MKRHVIRRDAQGVFVVADGYIVRPALPDPATNPLRHDQYRATVEHAIGGGTAAMPSMRIDGTTAYAVGDKVVAAHRGGSNWVNVVGTDPLYTEIWFAHCGANAYRAGALRRADQQQANTEDTRVDNIDTTDAARIAAQIAGTLAAACAAEGLAALHDEYGRLQTRLARWASAPTGEVERIVTTTVACRHMIAEARNSSARDNQMVMSLFADRHAALEGYVASICRAVGGVAFAPVDWEVIMSRAVDAPETNG